MVISAGVLRLGTIDVFTLEDFDQVLNVNIRGVYVAIQAAVARMGENGRVITIGSNSAVRPMMPIGSVYAMSKAAELALMRHIARKYGPKGIRANAIAPGLIWHYKFDEQWMPEGIVEQTRARQMIKARFGNPDDVAALGALLLSDDGSFITAQTISVDGGVTFRP